MIERFAQGKLHWVNLKRPTIDEIKKVMAELDLSPILMADLTNPIPRNYAQRIENTIKITLDFPTVKRIDVEHRHEVKFIISKNSLLTIQYEEMSGIDKFKRQFEVAATLRKKQKTITGMQLFISLINALYEGTFLKLDYLESQLNELESEVFNHETKQMVFEIAGISKKIISFQHILLGHEDVFREAYPFFADVYKNQFETELKDIQIVYFTILRHTKTLYETLTALRDTNTAIINTRQNEIIKNLTLMAFITYPLTLISSIFGMNTDFTPIIGLPGDFWFVIFIMLGASLFFYFFFKRKNWL